MVIPRYLGKTDQSACGRPCCWARAYLWRKGLIIITHEGNADTLAHFSMLPCVGGGGKKKRGRRGLCSW